MKTHTFWFFLKAKISYHKDFQEKKDSPCFWNFEPQKQEQSMGEKRSVVR